MNLLLGSLFALIAESHLQPEEESLCQVRLQKVGRIVCVYDGYWLVSDIHDKSDGEQDVHVLFMRHHGPARSYF